jgi:hypothetical protein
MVTPDIKLEGTEDRHGLQPRTSIHHNTRPLGPEARHRSMLRYGRLYRLKVRRVGTGFSPYINPAHHEAFRP